MSNDLILAPEFAGLPADLKNWCQSLLGLADAASGGISSGGHPRLSIKGREFSAIDADNNENRVGGFSNEAGRFVDVVVVGANPGVSKIYYDKPFDPAVTEPVAPTCFSDNGIGPSSRAEQPQCATCAACPHNVWGSKVTPGGSQIKACADAKKVAVLLTEDIQGPIYELRIPAASMKGFATFAGSLKTRGVPLPMVVMSLTFDASVTYPKLMFKPARYVDGKTELPVIQEVLAEEGEQIAEAVGSKDTPAAGDNVVSLNRSAQPQPQPQPQPVATQQPSNLPPKPAEQPAPTGRRRRGAAAAPAPTPAPEQATGLGSFGGFDDAPGAQTQAKASGGHVPTDAALDNILAGINFG